MVWDHCGVLLCIIAARLVVLALRRVACCAGVWAVVLVRRGMRLQLWGVV